MLSLSWVAGDIGFDGFMLPAAHNELGLYARSVREPNAVDVDMSRLSLSPSTTTSSTGGGAAEVGDVEVPMDVDDAVTKTKSPERSRLLLSTTVLDAGPDAPDDVYDYGMSLVAKSVYLYCLL